MKRLEIWLVLLLSLLSITLAVYLVRQDTNPDNFADSIWRADAPTIGVNNASIKIVEFGDFQCPACKEASPILEELQNEYSDKVSLQYRHLPLPEHKAAYDAALASEVAKHFNRFWEYHDMLLENQDGWSKVFDPVRALRSFAVISGVDGQEFDRIIKLNETKRSVDQDINLAKQLSIKGTPTIYINGRMYDGPLSKEGIDNAIRQLINKSK